MSDVAQRVREFLAQQVFRETPWEFSTSSGIELAIGTPLAHVGFNATGGCLWVKDGPNGAPQKLRYGGVGGSGGLALVPTKINLSFSMPQMQSFGKVYALPFANDQLSFDDLKGPFMVVTYATDFGGTVYFGDVF